MNTRKLIEGLYRQKFNAESEYKDLTFKIVEAESMDVKNTAVLLKNDRRAVEQRQTMIDELLIEFFGE